MNKKKPYRAPNAQTVDLGDPLMAFRLTFSEARVFEKKEHQQEIEAPLFKMEVVEGNPQEIYAKPHNLWEDDE